MKKIHMIAALLAMLLPTMVFAGVDSHSTHYGKVQAASTGNGSVYIATTKDAASGLSSDTWDCGGSSSSDAKTYFWHANPNAGYKFSGWFTSSTCDGDPKSKDNPYSEAVSAASTDDKKPTTVSYYAKFEPKVIFVVACERPVGGSYKVGNATYSSSSPELASTEYDDNYTAEFSTPTADADYEFYGWYEKSSNGVKKYISYNKTASKMFSSGTNIIGAEFRKKADVKLTFQPTDGIAYTVAGSETVDGDVYVMDNQAVGSKEVALSISSTIDKQPLWWYKADEFSEKVYFSYDKSVTKTFTASAIVGVDLVHSEKSLAKVLDGVESGTVTLTSDAEVLDGTAVTIPVGVEVVVPEGKTLYVDGSLTVNGTLTVNGSVSKCLKLIKQSGEDGLRPVNPYGSVKYWKSAKAVSSTASVNNWSGTIGAHLTVMRGDGVAVRGAITSNTKLVKCTFDGKVAVNHVTAIGDASDSDSILTNDSYTLLAAVTINGPKSTVSSDKDYDRIDCGSTIDCAGWGCTMGTKQISSNSSCVMVNAATFAYTAAWGNYWQGGTVKFYNCPSISIEPIKGTPTFHLYDSGTSALTFTQNSSGTAKCQFYSGKFDTDLSGNGPSWINADGARIYGGCFKKQPNDKWIETETKKTHAFCQHADGYWYLDVKQDTSVAKIGSTPYDTIDEALHYLTENDSATITLLRDVTLDQAYALNSGKSLVVELNGCRINAPNGFVVNNGTLSIRDKDNRLDASGISVGEGANIVENCADGSVDICYGAYDGNFVNRGTFTTHHGKFKGSVTNDGGTMNIKGGMFLQDVSEFMNEEYLAFNYDGWYYAGRFPKPVVGQGGAEYGEFARTLLAMPSNDATLYRIKKYTSLGDMDIDEWKYVAELKSAYMHFEDFYFDILLSFDREVAAESVSSKVKTQLGPRGGSVSHMDADIMDRIFSPQITMTKISYARFIYDNGEGNYDDLEAGINNEKSENVGTTCTLAMDIWKWHDSKKKDYIVSYLTILKKSFVFGAGDNAAMLQTASGAVPNENFFATLAAAVASEKTTGKTIKLCNDCTEVLTVNKSCTIDPNGFAFTGALTPGEGLSVKAVNGVYVFSAPDPADVFVEQVNVQNVVSDEWKTDNGLSADATQEEVQEALKQTDGNGNAKWANLVIGQKADEKAAVTAANGGDDKTANIEVTFEVPKDENGDAVATGYTVEYAFDKIDVSTGHVVENGAGEAKEAPTLDFKEVKANEPTYFKMRAVLKASDDGNVTAEVPVEKTIGVVKVASDAEVTIIPVPWQSLGTGDIKASELVHAASLSNDDELIVYGTDGKTQTWIVQNGEWTAPAAEYTIGGGGSEPQQEESQDPAELKRGQGVILKRKDTNKEIVLIGQPVANETEKVETPIAAATSSTEPSWNLVASPKMEAVAVADVASDNTSDEIIVPTAGTPKHYTYKNGDWGYPGGEVTEEVNHPALGKIKVIKTEHKTGDTTINAGTGFWYLNKGTSKSINWK